MGDNILIVHGGGPTAVMNASLYGTLKEAKKHPQIHKIYAAKNGIGGLLSGNLIDMSNIPEENLERLLYTPGSAVGTSREHLEPAEYDEMSELLKKKKYRVCSFYRR